jgi:polyisoprenoid-binding protein YceI
MRNEKTSVVAALVALAAVVSPNTWSVQQGDVRVICPITVGGSFDAKTTAISGSVTAGAVGSTVLDGSFAVDLRALDTGIGLRNDHLRERYLEVNRGPGYDTATLSEIDLKGLDPHAPEGNGSFTGVLTLHGVTKRVTGSVDVHETRNGLRINASFPVNLSEYDIPAPRYLGVGVRNTVRVEAAFAVTQ